MMGSCLNLMLLKIFIVNRNTQLLHKDPFYQKCLNLFLIPLELGGHLICQVLFIEKKIFLFFKNVIRKS